MPDNHLTLAENQQTQNILMRCLARHVLREYPNKLKRSQFYDSWKRRHGSDSLHELLALISLEYASYQGWCDLFSRSVSYSAMLDYLDDTKNSLASVQESSSPLALLDPLPSADRAFYSPLRDDVPACPPWWSELPHLAPVQGGHYAQV